MSEEIKPCPFCGSDNIKACEQPQDCGWFIRCENCFTEGPSPKDATYWDEQKAIEIWNDRQCA